jgi:hypothetical protein
MIVDTQDYCQEQVFSQQKISDQECGELRPQLWRAQAWADSKGSEPDCGRITAALCLSFPTGTIIVPEQ